MEIKYDKFPTKKVNESAFCGWEAIAYRIKEEIAGRTSCIIVADCYPGTDQAELLNGLSALGADNIIHSDDAAFSPSEMESSLAEQLTDDRVFGRMTTKTLADYFHTDLLNEAKRQAASKKGITLIYGVGAALIAKGDIMIYADLSRWEIQLRYRAGMANWRAKNENAPILSKYKRGFFAEWRWADAHKHSVLKRADFIIDTNKKNKPVMALGTAVFTAIKKFSCEPFRTVPYFDPGVWGGQWMKKVCGLDENEKNFAWSFDGVPEENSILIDFNGAVMELPAIDVVLERPKELLGEHVYNRFGAEFPIRFDFLDTMGGQNLSLQVHPLKEYIKEQFGMAYTQDESYYFLDAKAGARVYLGVKSGIDREEMMKELRRAEKGEIVFPADKYINSFDVKKHDHALIPSGTIHCSGADTMVLEISATPYIFTFKLWDWERVGLDGLPRPIHLDHGEKNIQWDRDTKWTEQNLIHREHIIEKGDGVTIERTGLHELEFIDTLRYTIEKSAEISTEGGVNVLNLVEGEAAEISSPIGAFEPYEVHYAETFIVPAAVKKYVIAPKNCAAVKVICATVRK